MNATSLKKFIQALTGLCGVERAVIEETDLPETRLIENQNSIDV